MSIKLLRIIPRFFNRQQSSNCQNLIKLQSSYDNPLEYNFGIQENGFRIITNQTKSNLTRIVLTINAGSYFEETHERGLNHVIRHMFLSSNQYNTMISNTRALYQIGADVSVECSRDNFVVKVTCGQRYLFHVLDFIGSAISYPKSYYHELAYSLQSCLIEYDNLKTNLITENILDELHFRLFREGYGNSLFVRSDCEETLREWNALEFFKKNYRSTSCAIAVSSPLSYSSIAEFISESFELPNLPKSPYSPIKSYSGETIIPYETRHYHTALGYIAPAKNSKTWATYYVLKKYLGSRDHFSQNSQTQFRSAMQNIDTSLKISTFYFAYNLSGVFGIYIIAPRKNYKQSIESIAKIIKNIFTSNVDEVIFKSAIEQAKFELSEQYSTGYDTLVDYSNQAAFSDKIFTLQDKLALIDFVTIKDIKAALTNIHSTRPVLVSQGNPSYIPSLDDVHSWLK